MVSILERARKQRRATNLVTDEMAQQIIAAARREITEAHAAVP